MASFPLEAASREQEQIDVRCITEREGILLPPHIQNQTREVKDHKAGEEKSLS